MTVLAFSAYLLGFSFFAGVIGALTGLGGGVIIIPVLVLFLQVDMHEAMGASLISVMATSSGSAAAYLREGYSNLRIGIFLETAAVLCAVIGALLVAFFSKTWLGIIFSFVLFFSAYLTMKRKEDYDVPQTAHPWATFFKLNGRYPEKNVMKSYQVQHVPAAFCILGIAGFLAGLLGIGSGTLKVLAMDQAMRLPYKVATTTSNFMIGITAAASAGIYCSQGYINPKIVFPVMIGVLAGAFFGAKILTKIHTRFLRILFACIVFLIGIQMLYHALKGLL